MIACVTSTPTTRQMGAAMRGRFVHVGVEWCRSNLHSRLQSIAFGASAIAGSETHRYHVAYVLMAKSSLSAIHHNQHPRCRDQHSLPIFLSSEQRPAPRKNMAT